MSKELFPAGAVVIAKGGNIPGTSKGRAQYGGERRVIVALYNGRSEAYHENELRIATEDDIKKYEDRKRRDEETDRRAKDREDRKRQQAAENEEARRRAKEEEAQAKEEARRKEKEELTAEMRKKYARIYGLESLRKP